MIALVVHRWWPARFLTPIAASMLGWPVLAGGLVLLGWFVLTMRRARTPIDPTAPVTCLVTTGPFRYTRNPAYLACAMIYVGLASLANTLWAVLLLPAVLAVVHWGVIAREERYLERMFGEEYLRYRAQVSRWV